MIYLFSGKTGAGKTLTMVEEVYKRWLNGENVASNFLLFYDLPLLAKLREKLSHIIKYKPLKKIIQPKRHGKIVYFSDIDDVKYLTNCIIMFDEGQELFGVQSLMKNDREFIAKLRFQRKQHLDIYTTTQNLASIDINYRRLIHSIIYCQSRFHTLFSFHYFCVKKDINEFSSLTRDESELTNIKIIKRLIWKIKKKKYDTDQIVKTKPVKMMLLMGNDRTRIYIIPRSMKLKEALSAMSTCNSQLRSKEPKE